MIAAYCSPGGRPPNVQPMQPFRTPTRPRIHSHSGSTPNSHKIVSPLRYSVKRYHVPVFSRPPGPSKAIRLSRNSLFPNTAAVQHAAASMSQQPGKYLPATQPDMHQEPDVQNALSRVDGLTAEEERMEDSLDFTRWNDPLYRLRQDEMCLYMDILNHSTLARRRGMIFKQSPDTALARVMEAWLPSTQLSLCNYVGGVPFLHKSKTDLC